MQPIATGRENISSGDQYKMRRL